MKVWKKILVCAVAIMMITVIQTSIYVSVSTNAIVSIDTQHSYLQLFAGDVSVSGESIGGHDHEYLLEYTMEDGFRLNLGTWGGHNEFVSSAAFGVANAGGSDLLINGVRVEGDHADEFIDSVKVWFHGAEHDSVLNTENSIPVIDSSIVYSDHLRLTSVDQGAYQDGFLLIDGAESNANWMPSYEGGDDYLWHLPNDEEISFDRSNAGVNNDASAVWLRFETDPTAVPDGTEITDFTIHFDVEYIPGDPPGPLFEEDFTGVSGIPDGWTEVPTGRWETVVDDRAGGTAPELKFDRSPSTTDTFRIYTPAIDSTGYEEFELSFAHFMDDSGDRYSIRVETSSDGEDWDTIWSLSPSDDVGPETVTIDFSDNVGSETFYIAWTLDGNTFDVGFWGWRIDDIVLMDTDTIE